MISMFLFFLHLGFDSHCGVGNYHQALFGNEFARDTANAIGLVFDTDEGCIQVFNEFLLACGSTQKLIMIINHWRITDEHFSFMDKAICAGS